MNVIHFSLRLQSHFLLSSFRKDYYLYFCKFCKFSLSETFNVEFKISFVQVLTKKAMLSYIIVLTFLILKTHAVPEPELGSRREENNASARVYTVFLSYRAIGLPSV